MTWISLSIYENRIALLPVYHQQQKNGCLVIDSSKKTKKKHDDNDSFFCFGGMILLLMGGRLYDYYCITLKTLKYRLSFYFDFVFCFVSKTLMRSIIIFEY